MKTLYESLLDDEETLMKNTDLIDLYSLIKDKIKAMSYVYFSLGYTHGFDTKKCLKLASKDEVLKTINGKTMNPGGILGKIMPIFLKQIIVNPQFITHNFDESYMKSSAEQTFNYVVANDLRNHTDLDRARTGTKRFPYFYVEMRNGALYIYYDWGAKPDTSKGFSSERGNGRIIIRF
jgi:hypothetical protein